MKNSSIFRTLTNNNPVINAELSRAKYYLKNDQFLKAAEKYKIVGKHFIELGLMPYAIDCYDEASQLFIRADRYLKAINCQLLVSEIYEITSNIDKQGYTHGKIASWFRWYLKNLKQAGDHYLQSANCYIQAQNYFKAFNNAEFAFQCFDEIKSVGKCKNALGLAIRTSLQLNHHGRAGFSIKKMYTLIDKDFSPDHISIARKGYKTCKQIGQYVDAFMFIDVLIESHFKHGVEQKAIIELLLEAQQLHLQAFKKINSKYCDYMESKLKDFEKISLYYLELRKFSEDVGLREVADDCFIKENNYQKKSYKEKRKYISYLSFKFWQFSSNYGTNPLKWILLSVLISVIFGLIFSSFPCPEYFPNPIKNILCAMNPTLSVNSYDSVFSPFYFSIVTFTTLGFGDITPQNLAAQIFIVAEVLIGYLMLGGLITIFFRKIIR